MNRDDYLILRRNDWAALRGDVLPGLTENDLPKTSGARLDEVEAVYLPLLGLVQSRVDAARAEARAQGEFQHVRPYVIAVAGSVAVGKSTFARLLQALLARLHGMPRVELVTTDGFLYPNETLTRAGILERKGFPESYDREAMTRFLAALKNGASELRVPFHSHVTYDVVPGRFQTVTHPDMLVFEGINALGEGADSASIDFSVYLHANEADIERWFVERFLEFCRTTFQDPDSYFRHFGDLSADAASTLALRVWRDINRVNLIDNILPTRDRADVVLHKASDHRIDEVWLRNHR